MVDVVHQELIYGLNKRGFPYVRYVVQWCHEPEPGNILLSDTTYRGRFLLYFGKPNQPKLILITPSPAEGKEKFEAIVNAFRNHRNGDKVAVKIMQASSPFYWYADKIGESFDVVYKNREYETERPIYGNTYGFIQEADCDICFGECSITELIGR